VIARKRWGKKQKGNGGRTEGGCLWRKGKEGGKDKGFDKKKKIRDSPPGGKSLGGGGPRAVRGKNSLGGEIEKRGRGGNSLGNRGGGGG